MRLLLGLALVLAACDNDVDPRVIPGGGVGDGEIDGEVNVHIIDTDTEEPIAGATVAIGDTEKTTDAKGRVIFSDVEGAQTIAVRAEGYRSHVWVKVNGANVTIPIKAQSLITESANLSGTIANWSSINPPQGHGKVAYVTYSQTDDLGAKENAISTPNNGQRCIEGLACNWTINTRTGTVSLLALILDYDPKGTPAMDDDTLTPMAYAYKTGITVNAGVNQSGLVLDQIEPGNLETVTVDIGTPPPGLPETTSIPGIELGKNELFQLPFFIFMPDATSFLMPKRTVFGGEGTYRLTAIAQTTSGDDSAQSFVVRSGLTTPNLEAGDWLVPPVNVSATRTTASFDPVAGAKLHLISWKDSMDVELLEITVFDSKIDEVEVPNLVALPTSGTLTARVSGLAADFDLNDFNLEEDSDLLTGIAGQPVTIP